MSGLVKGARDFFSGCRVLVTTPGLWAYAWIPIIINTLIYALVVGGGVYFFPDLMEMFLPVGDSWYFTVLRVFTWVVFSVTVGLAIYFTFFAVTALLASPFNEVLSSKYEALIKGKSIDNSHDIPAVIKQEIKRFLIYLGVFICLLVFTLTLSLIPFVNLIVPVLWALFAGFLSAFEFLSYPLDRRAMTNREKLSFIRQRPARSLGFGLMVAGALMIPLVNLMVIPSAVVGATRLFLETEGEVV